MIPNTPESFFVWALAAFALCWVIGFSKLTLGARTWLGSREGAAFRWFVYLIECPMCLGFHLGFWWPFLHGRAFVPSFIFGLLITGSNLILSSWTGLVDNRSSNPP